MRQQLLFASGLFALFITTPAQAQWLYEPGWRDPAPIPRANIGTQGRALPPHLYRDPRYVEDDYHVLPRQRGSARSSGTHMASLPPDADPNYSGSRNYDTVINSRETTRRMVSDPTDQPSGTITVNTRTRKLYLSLGNGRAMEYGIGVGRQGFDWKGNATVGRKAVWPGWTPPAEMLKRRPDLPRHMEGGIDNPLGARALYLFQGNKDTLFRIHGTNEPDTIGQAVSSGCIRMLNADVIDLYQRVQKGAKVVVI